MLAAQPCSVARAAGRCVTPGVTHALKQVCAPRAPAARFHGLGPSRDVRALASKVSAPTGNAQAVCRRECCGARPLHACCLASTAPAPCRAAPSRRVDTPPPLLPRCAALAAVQAKFFVGGNWKCNGTHGSVEKLVAELNAGDVPDGIDVVVAPPFIFLDWVRANIKGQYQVAAQNCWVKSDGAFTGEISAEMLVDAHVPWVITGHSERRSLCGESNTFVGQKTGHALDVGLQVRPAAPSSRAAAAAARNTHVLLRHPGRHAQACTHRRARAQLVSAVTLLLAAGDRLHR